MRELYIAIGASILVAGIFVAVILFTQPQAHAQRNAYWPYSVETVIKDK